MDMDRRAFLRNAGLVSTWLGISIVLQACGDDSNPGTPNNGDVAGAISANHGHAVKITEAQLMAGGAVNLTLTGGGHAHIVSLTSGEVGQIGAGNQVSKLTTTTDTHEHTVTFN